MTASDTLMSVLGGGGSPVQECSACGRTHFCPDSRYNGEEDKAHIDYLISKAKTEPNKYIPWYECDSISYKTLAGHIIPVDCSCDYLERYERHLVFNRKMITDYYMMVDLSKGDDKEIDDKD